MDLPEELLLGAGIGLAKGIHDRNNDAMVADGVRPSWSRRHVVLTTFLWALAFLPVLLVVLLYGWIPLGWVVSFDQHHGNTGLIDLVVFTSPVWIWGIFAYRRAEARWGGRAPNGYVAITSRPHQSTPWGLIIGAVTVSIGGFCLWAFLTR